MNRCSISGNNAEQVLQWQITDLQGNLFVSGTNLGVGPGTFTILTTGTDNVCIGSVAGGGPYGLNVGSQNVMVAVKSGDACITGNNNTFLRYNTAFSGGFYYDGSIALRSGANFTAFNQLMVAPNVTAFNMASLAPSTGTSAGTILEFDLASNILPLAGTYKTVAAIDTAIALINAPNYFWFTDPTLSGTENDFMGLYSLKSANLDMNPIPWGCIV